MGFGSRKQLCGGTNDACKGSCSDSGGFRGIGFCAALAARSCPLPPGLRCAGPGSQPGLAEPGLAGRESGPQGGSGSGAAPAQPARPRGASFRGERSALFHRKPHIHYIGINLHLFGNYGVFFGSCCVVIFTCKGVLFWAVLCCSGLLWAILPTS